MSGIGSRYRLFAITGWLAGLLLCLFIIGRSSFSTDMSAFLPAAPTAEQQVLLDQLQNGVVSRLILTGIEGSDEATRIALSKELARLLRRSESFVAVNNGEPVNAERDYAFLFNNRYLLSAAVTPERFSRAGLHAALADTIDLLASPAGMLVKPLLPRDPTGEVVQLLEQISGGMQPAMRHGVWISRDASRSLLLVHTRAAGSDIDGQQLAIQQIEQAFEEAVQQQGAAAATARLLMTGPGIFAVESRNTIVQEVSRLLAASTVVIVLLLWFVYRSLATLALGLLPMLSGALVGVVAVSLGFGVVHGVTLGFGSALIGEAVDYAIYLFIQSRQATASGPVHYRWLQESWPTVRLGVLTSVTGFAALVLSDFPGLAQLGAYAIAGLTTAALITRYVLPHLLPRNFRIRDVNPLGERLMRVQQRAPMLRWPILLLTIAAALVVWQHRNALWNAELAALSPVPAAAQALDASLRADLGAPDVRYMVVVHGPDAEAVLRSSEAVSEELADLVRQGQLAGFQSPSHFLPSVETQRRRLSSLPGEGLEQVLQQAVRGLPVRAGLFSPFLEDVASARGRMPLMRADLEGTSLAALVDSLLFERNGRWTAVLPLTAPNDGQTMDAEAVRSALAKAGQRDTLFIDLKAQSDQLYGGYMREAVQLSAAGLAGIILLLMLTLRSLSRTIIVVFPLVAAALVVVALLMLAGQRLIILHLIGLLLIFAVGSNYALFFSRRQPGQLASQTLPSLLFANLTTVAGFGILGFSSVPVLQAIGTTVGPGALLSLVFSAAFAPLHTAGSKNARGA